MTRKIEEAKAKIAAAKAKLEEVREMALAAMREASAAYIAASMVYPDDADNTETQQLAKIAAALEDDASAIASKVTTALMAASGQKRRQPAPSV